jgi:hypothetical protein
MPFMKPLECSSGVLTKESGSLQEARILTVLYCPFSDGTPHRGQLKKGKFPYAKEAEGLSMRSSPKLPTYGP